MASHGTVYDLFDDRYMNLQDVAGIVDLQPTLVPYEEYAQHMLIYRMNTSAEVCLALLQDFTKRKSAEERRELWTWCVQWKVDKNPALGQVTPPHSPKKPRLNAPLLRAHVRTVNPDLMAQPDLLRILLDIIQVGATVVPNFIEFLYRWVDYYEGDGKALKAALHKDIPSLWDFDYHPLLFPRDVQKMRETVNGQSNTAGTDRSPPTSQATKSREKPDLAALHRQVEESERLKYREVHFGIQPPKINEPLPPLINVPRDPVKRVKFYTACFRSRQCAFSLLIEAGITPQQMRDYQRTQQEDPRDTPLAFGRDGLKHYRKDAELAQKVFAKGEKHVEKQMEVAISEKLAIEAQFAASRRATPEGNFGVPLIANRPVPMAAAARREDLGDKLLRLVREDSGRKDKKINIIPLPLAGRLKGTLFEGAMDKQALFTRYRRLAHLSAQTLANISGEGGLDTEMAGVIKGGEYGGSNHDLNDNGSAAGNRVNLPFRLAPNGTTNIPSGLLNSMPSHASNSTSWSLLLSSFPLASGFPPISGQETQYTGPSAALGLYCLASAYEFVQLLTAILANSSNLTPSQESQNAGPPVGRNPGPADIQRFLQNQQELSPALSSFLAAPRPGIQRNAPSPLRLAPSSSALNSLIPSISGACPFRHHNLGMPIQIYYPRILVPGNLIGPGGAMMGNNGSVETDALLIGYSQPGSGKITLTHGVFLPVGVWKNCMERVRSDKYSILETYVGPMAGRQHDTSSAPHRAAYEKLRQVHSLMLSSSPGAREHNLTKRWRVTPGKVSATQRGAVWEGWAVGVNKEISMSREEREGAFVYQEYIDHGVAQRYDAERERRKKEIAELLEDEDSWHYEDEEETEG
ncbi:hypothetical protein GMOD_00005261 [Pyrenophora seminiperda CCB06]|uniref:Uncharacterized protein n=1 Tax=Pyrenophora seminiperda CCB06 TaxID=1302712 RepID=A0A3M7LVD7_9PLEO|nr:hypothetical protein GMOD_00005261 [Pyrenophora seminiperda CCB06]